MFVVEGNIGAGKSTFLKLVNKYIDEVNIDLEPIDQWQNKLFGQSLLNNFYTNPNRWAFTMESFTLINRMAENNKKFGFNVSDKFQKNLIAERSIYSGYYCFANNSYNSGFLSPLEWNMYLKLFNFITDPKYNNNYYQPNGFIYLKTDPEISLDRVRNRNRKDEHEISLEYLKDISHRHDEYLISKTNLPERIRKIPVLVLDANQDFENNSNNLEDMLNSFIKFIKL